MLSNLEMLLRLALAAGLGSLAGLKPLEQRFWPARGGREFRLTADREAASLALVQSELATAGMAIRLVSIEPGDQSDEDEISLSVQATDPKKMLTPLERLRQLKGVRAVAAR